MRLGIDPKVDVVFKRLFGNEDEAPLLVSLLNAVLEQPGSVTGVHIVSPQSDKEFPQDKVVIADVKARDQGNRQFQVEMQWDVPWYFPKRILYYWGSFHPEQLRGGEHYITLRPTIAICFLNHALFPQVADHHLVFRLRDDKHNLLFCEDLEIHVLQLPKFTKAAEQLTTALDRWCYFMRYAADLDLENLPASLDVSDIRRAMEVLTLFTQDERERELYLQRRKIQLDELSRAAWHQETEQLAKDTQQRLKDVELAEQRIKDAEQRLKDDQQRLKDDEQRIKDAQQRIKDDEQRLKEAEQLTKEVELAEQRIKDVEQRAKDTEQRAKDAAERGREEGLKAGALGRIHLAQRLLKQPMRSREELLQLPLDELLRLAETLEQQLFPSTNGAS